VFEVEQRITEDPLNSCECGSTGTVKRVIQPVGISFKGSGFHINDYSNSGSASTTKPEDADIPAEKPKDKPAETSAAPAPEPASPSSGTE
jgi:predicted nucleic acid-binding Zn ribbon protein